jgi:hypothetical protein
MNPHALSEIIGRIALSPILAIAWLWHWWRERKTEDEE